MNGGEGSVTQAVFVPGLMGAGILLSAAILVSDGIKRAAPNRGVRRRIAVAEAIHYVVAGAARAAGYVVPEREAPPRRLRSRWTYACLGALAAILGVLVTSAGFRVFADAGATLHENPWVIALAVAADVPLAAVGGLSLVFAVLHERAPDPVLRLARSTWLGRLMPPPEDARERAMALVPWLEDRSVR